MTQSDDLVTPQDVEKEMVDLTSRLERAPKIVKDHHNAMRELRRQYKLAYALAYTSTDGTVEYRKMQAEVDTAEIRERLDTAEIEYKFACDAMDALRTKLRALQSISSLMKASMFGVQGGI